MSIPLAPTATTAVSEQLLDQISSTAHSVDTGATQARYALPLLAAEGALDLGLGHQRRWTVRRAGPRDSRAC
ncbi:hypothetical protein [Corynebacterium sp. 73A]|uniref:hypothetical protein n=1 Tax=Corynebacterium sp. 73A TaxID=2080500 RepID=UPI001CEFA314|nr:hypothetical protein [Corynebacterium sp. 73A]